MSKFILFYEGFMYLWRHVYGSLYSIEALTLGDFLTPQHLHVYKQ